MKNKIIRYNLLDQFNTIMYIGEIFHTNDFNEYIECFIRVQG